MISLHHKQDSVRNSIKMRTNFSKPFFIIFSLNKITKINLKKNRWYKLIYLMLGLMVLYYRLIFKKIYSRFSKHFLFKTNNKKITF